MGKVIEFKKFLTDNPEKIKSTLSNQKKFTINWKLMLYPIKFVINILWIFVTVTIVFWWLLLFVLSFLNVLTAAIVLFVPAPEFYDRIVNTVLPFSMITLGVCAVIFFQRKYKP